MLSLSKHWAGFFSSLLEEKDRSCTDRLQPMALSGVGQKARASMGFGVP
jgi:hypothetical protein